MGNPEEFSFNTSIPFEEAGHQLPIVEPSSQYSGEAGTRVVLF
jgi:hypothetical protein